MMRFIGITFGMVTVFCASIFYAFNYLLETMPITPLQSGALIAMAFGGVIYGCLYETKSGLLAAAALLSFLAISTFNQATSTFFAFVVTALLLLPFLLIITGLLESTNEEENYNELSK